MGAKISVLMFISFVQYGWGSFLRSILKEQAKVKCRAKGAGMVDAIMLVTRG
jgi:hypothetical protein